MPFVCSNQSRCDPFTLWFYGQGLEIIVSVPDIAMLNFEVNNFLVYLDERNLHSELS